MPSTAASLLQMKEDTKTFNSKQLIGQKPPSLGDIGLGFLDEKNSSKKEVHDEMLESFGIPKDYIESIVEQEVEENENEDNDVVVVRRPRKRKKNLFNFKLNPFNNENKKPSLSKNTAQTLDGINKQFTESTKDLGIISTIGKAMDTNFGIILLSAAAILAAIAGINSVLNGASPFGSESESESDYGSSGLSNGRLSEKGIKFLQQEEGLRTEAYLDSKKRWTIGIGHTGPVDGKPIHAGMTITKEKAIELFKEDVAKFENYVNKHVKVPVTQNMFDAMVSYAFNVGYLGPKFLKKLNSGDYKGAMQELTTINAELEGRRKREQALFGTDITEDNKIRDNAVIIQPAPTAGPKVKATDSGNMNRLYNGQKVGGYTMTNVTSHYDKYTRKNAKFIDLSDRAKAYLMETGGQGIVTSGAEGLHAPGEISHKSGNKIDVQGLSGANTSNREYAELCVRFLKNPNTAYINLESFTWNDIKEVVKFIEQMDSEAANLANKPTPYKPGQDRSIIYNKGRLLTSLKNPGHPRHLDIGILPNAYTKEQQKQQDISNPSNQPPNISKNNTNPSTQNASTKKPSTQKPSTQDNKKQQPKQNNNGFKPNLVQQNGGQTTKQNNKSNGLIDIGKISRYLK